MKLNQNNLIEQQLYINGIFWRKQIVNSQQRNGGWLEAIAVSPCIPVGNEDLINLEKSWMKKIIFEYDEECGIWRANDSEVYIGENNKLYLRK